MPYSSLYIVLSCLFVKDCLHVQILNQPIYAIHETRFKLEIWNNILFIFVPYLESLVSLFVWLPVWESFPAHIDPFTLL